jgi:chemotaxis protein MotB
MRKKRDEIEETPEGAPPWMVTYGDVMSLLLTFFVLLASFSSIQESKFHNAVSSLRLALGTSTLKGNLPGKQTLSSIVEKEEEMISEVQAMQAEISGSGLKGEVKVTLTDKGLHIIIADPLLFDLGKDQLKEQVIPILDIVANMIKRHPEVKVVVEGHTDNIPINNARFASNWELSVARALSVVKYFAFKKGIEPARLAATGYGEFRPLKPNDSPDNQAKNRRVEIFVNIESGTTFAP